MVDMAKKYGCVFVFLSFCLVWFQGAFLHFLFPVFFCASLDFRSPSFRLFFPYFFPLSLSCSLFISWG